MKIGTCRHRWIVTALLLMPVTRLGAQSPGENPPAGFLRAALAREVARLAQAPAPPAAPGPHRSWPARHPVLTGTLIGAGTIAALNAAGQRNRDGAITGVWVLGGAGAGALGGAIVSAARTGDEKDDRGQNVKARRVSTAKKVGIVAGIAGAVAVSWLICYGVGGCGGVS